MAVNRYLNLNQQRYQQQYTPVPFEAIMQVGAQKQAIQDKGQADLATVQNGIKEIKALPQYTEYAKEKVGEITEGINKYATMDFNDPNTRQQWNKERGSIAARFAPTGDLGKINMDYQLGTKWQSEYIKNAKDQGWGTDVAQQRSNEVLNTFKDDERNFQGEGTSAKVDTHKFINEALDNLSYDSSSLGLSGAYGTGVEFLNAFRTGKMDYLDKEKIMNALIQQAQGNTDLQNSLKQQARFSGQDENNATQFVTKDEAGKTSYNFSNPFVMEAAGAASGKAFKRVDEDWKLMNDQAGLDRNKHAIEHPVVAIGMPVTNNQWINAFGTSKAVEGQKTATKDATSSSWKQMMLDSPELWSQFGIKNAKDVDTIGNILGAEGGVGYDAWMKQNGSKFGNKANGVNSALTEYRMVSQLDNEANEYALKISGVNPESLNNIVKSSSDPIIQKMSAEDVLSYHNAVNTLATYKGGPKDGKLINAEKERDLLLQRYGNINGQEIENTFKKIDNSQSKYNKAKDSYLTDRAKIVETSQTGWSTIDVVSPNGTVDKESSDKLNKTLQTYFGDKKNLSGVYTTKLDENGLPMTVQQVIDEEASKSGVTSDKVSVGSTPLYGTGYDKTTGKIGRNMYITVGGQQVPIDMSSVNVEINGRVQPLSNVDSNPVQQTNLWITNTFGHGIQEYQPDNTVPIAVMGATDNNGNVIVPEGSTTFKVSKPTPNNSTGNFSDNSTTKVQLFNSQGKVVSTLVGDPAFKFLQTVQATQGLK